MIKKNFAKNSHYLIAFIFYLFCVSCQGPLAGETTEFLTPNIYKNLPPEATQIKIITKKSNWVYDHVNYNDTIVMLSTGRIHHIDYDGEIFDPTFSYDVKAIDNKWVTEITGSFFSIKSERPKNSNESTVITVDITENGSKEKRVLSVQLLNLDTGGYFRIEQNPK